MLCWRSRRGKTPNSELFNLVTAILVLLGVILGVQILIEGITLLLFGLISIKAAE